MTFSMGSLWSRQKTDEVENQLKLQKECKDNIYKLDETMVKLLMSLDAMHATAEMLLRYLNISDGDTDDKAVLTNKNIWERKAVAARLLIKMERIVCTEKQDVVNSLITFLHFVIFNAEEIFKADSGGFNTLKLDAYINDTNEWHCAEDHYIETIQNENKTLTERNAILENKIQNLKSRLTEEENNSRKRIEHVQNELTKLRAKVAGSQKQKK
ncbi:uncharacterized protein LOC123537519 isoform X2 [Mercenaria mercenaria]|uniref:uncharacterized protein LOC123537519 isoform X2 n=1 Tax=Mercenaria mercenaria TaxID=6596 RepID=UPI00234F827A|nr:uncharacterized protein LOC123537519 isoform X2 [Mercenaria mercenaria]XP_053389411.1 uncharacterized protein LOC123537519 isoform X2 [Mercenaria mercenaria]